MLAWLDEFLAADGFMPHGHCYLWQPSLVWLHVSGDLLIGFAYVAISITLYHLVRIIRIPFSSITLSFGVFIGACSLTHFMEVWNLWHANYWWAGVVKALTAFASATSALWLIRLKPQIVFVAHAAAMAEQRRQQLETLNATLQVQTRELAANNLLLAEQQKMLIQSAKMSALGEMAGGLAHEINSPLAIIMLRSQQLQRSLHKEAISREYIKKEAEAIASTAARIGSIIKGLQSFAREGDKDPFENAAVSVVLCDALALCQERLKSQDIQLTVSRVPLDLAIWCRSVQICQVILNLLVNAYDAAINRPEKWIDILVEDMGQNVRVCITDSGAGIAPEVQARIMQPFFTTKEVGKGTGLGLSVSQGIVADHHGDLSLDTTAPNTRFVLVLPKERQGREGL